MPPFTDKDGMHCSIANNQGFQPFLSYVCTIPAKISVTQENVSNVLDPLLLLSLNSLPYLGINLSVQCPLGLPPSLKNCFIYCIVMDSLCNIYKQRALHLLITLAEVNSCRNSCCGRQPNLGSVQQDRVVRRAQWRHLLECGPPTMAMSLQREGTPLFSSVSGLFAKTHLAINNYSKVLKVGSILRYSTCIGMITRMSFFVRSTISILIGVSNKPWSVIQPLTLCITMASLS